MKYLKPDVQKLTAYGFTHTTEGVYAYSTYNSELNMKLCVKVNIDGNLTAHIYDCDTDDEYTLHAVEGATGEFVGKVRLFYAEELEKIADCFESNMFAYRQTEEIIGYVGQKYGDEPEYLWEDTPDCCIMRRKDNRKWYLVIMTVNGTKLGLENRELEIIDIRCPEDELNGLADGEKYFRGWHMNKRLWMTLVLDGRVPTEEIKQRIDKGYALALKK